MKIKGTMYPFTSQVFEVYDVRYTESEHKIEFLIYNGAWIYVESFQFKPLAS